MTCKAFVVFVVERSMTVFNGGGAGSRGMLLGRGGESDRLGYISDRSIVRSFALSITRCREQSAKNTKRKSLSCTVPLVMRASSIGMIL